MTEEKSPPPEPTPSPLDWLALGGLCFVAVGVFLSLGLGPALAVVGGMMLVTALVLAVSRARAGRT